MPVHRDNPSIRVSAVVLTNDDGQIALVRKQGTTAFMFPGGKPEADEAGLDAAVREVAEELGLTLDPQDLEYVGDYTTPAANEPNTWLFSQVYAARVPIGARVQAQAEIAELIWVTPDDVVINDGHQLAPLSAQVLQELANGRLSTQGSLDMNLEAFEILVGEELDALEDEIVGGLDNVVFAVEDRPEDGSLDLLGIYEGFDLPGRADYGYAQLPDRIVLFREPLLAVCADEAQLREQVRITLIHEIAHYYGIDDAQLHELGWA